MTRIASSVFALISLFIFPWPVSLALIAAAAFLFPASGIALGVLADILYYSPDVAFLPYFSIYGALLTGLSLLVRRFVKTRIMEA